MSDEESISSIDSLDFVIIKMPSKGISSESGLPSSPQDAEKSVEVNKNENSDNSLGECEDKRNEGEDRNQDEELEEYRFDDSDGVESDDDDKDEEESSDVVESDNQEKENEEATPSITIDKKFPDSTLEASASVVKLQNMLTEYKEEINVRLQSMEEKYEQLQEYCKNEMLQLSKRNGEVQQNYVSQSVLLEGLKDHIANLKEKQQKLLQTNSDLKNSQKQYIQELNQLKGKLNDAHAFIEEDFARLDKVEKVVIQDSKCNSQNDEQIAGLKEQSQKLSDRINAFNEHIDVLINSTIKGAFIIVFAIIVRIYLKYMGIF